MDSKKILSADFLDILFEGRNKTYGAYDLRKTYGKRLQSALGAMFIICILVSFFSMRPAGKKHGSIKINVDDVHISKIEDQQKPDIQPPEKKPVQVQTVSYTIPIIVNKEIEPQDEIKPVEELSADVKIGTADIEGTKSDITPPVEINKGIGIEAPKSKDDQDIIFTNVSIEAKFKGGTDAWRRFLERNLINSIAADNGARAGSYRVVISFVVDKEGTISDVKVESDPGYGTAAEAVRVIRKSPKWEPAQQNDHYVSYRQKQAITFVVEDN